MAALIVDHRLPAPILVLAKGRPDVFAVLFLSRSGIFRATLLAPNAWQYDLTLLASGVCAKLELVAVALLELVAFLDAYRLSHAKYSIFVCGKTAHQLSK